MSVLKLASSRFSFEAGLLILSFLERCLLDACLPPAQPCSHKATLAELTLFINECQNNSMILPPFLSLGTGALKNHNFPCLAISGLCALTSSSDLSTDLLYAPWLKKQRERWTSDTRDMVYTNDSGLASCMDFHSRLHSGLPTLPFPFLVRRP